MLILAPKAENWEKAVKYWSTLKSDPNAKALGYVADASNAKSDKFKAGSNCSNCALFQGGQGDAGNCPLFGGKKVAAAGWCTAWAPK